MEETEEKEGWDRVGGRRKTRDGRNYQEGGKEEEGKVGEGGKEE